MQVLNDVNTYIDEDPGGTGESRLKNNEPLRPIQNKTFIVPAGNRAELRCNIDNYGK